MSGEAWRLGLTGPGDANVTGAGRTHEQGRRRESGRGKVARTRCV